VGQKLLKLVREYDFGLGKSQTISLGLTEIYPGQSLTQLLIQVDKALYVAKAAGRDQMFSMPAEDTQNAL
jgi:PleD family two-component response regulator